MEDFIRNITHDEHKFNDDWPENRTKLWKFVQEKNIDTPLNVYQAFIDYVDEDQGTFHTLKLVFIEQFAELLCQEYPLPLDEAFPIFMRLFNFKDINHWPNLTLLESFNHHLQIGNRIAAERSKTYLDKIVEVLIQHPFINETLLNVQLIERWTNLLCRGLLVKMIPHKNDSSYQESLDFARGPFQKLFR